MYKGLAFFVGIIIAGMVSVNGVLASMTGPYFSNFIYHVLGFILILIVLIFKKQKKFQLKEIPLIFFLPGILSVLVVVLNNVCINKMGVTLTIAVSLFGQLIISGLIDNYGLFQMPVIKFRKEKLIGYSFILVGIVFMILL
ncbi:MAG: DMT family transporter [Vulcanibacillus sp.]